LEEISKSINGHAHDYKTKYVNWDCAVISNKIRRMLTIALGTLDNEIKIEI